MLVLEASAGGAAASSSKEAQTPAAAPAAPASAAPASTISASSTIQPEVADSKVLATPSTRRLARELGININGINGSGLAGRVTREDVLSQSGGAGAVVAEAPKMKLPELRPMAVGLPNEEERVALRGIRRKIAKQMQITKQIVPHFTLMDEANVSELYTTRAKVKEIGKEYGVKVTYLQFVMKALVALSLIHI